MESEERQQFWSLIDEKLESRLNSVQENGFTGLNSQEMALSEELSVKDKVVTFAAFKELLPSGDILVVVQATTPAFFGLGWRSMEKGVVIELNGSVRKATEKELWYVI